MRTVYKYPLEIEEEQEIEIHDAALLLCVQVQSGFSRDTPCIWALVDPDRPTVRRRVTTHGTGHPINGDLGEYVGTYQLAGGNLIFHVFAEA